MAKTIEIGPYSAYAIAVANGYDGTEEEWLASLVGPRGAQGASITGVKIDGNEHIIVTVHDPATNTDTTIDAGPIDNTSAVQSIQQAAQAAITQVTQAQTAGVNAVNSARDTALQQVAASTEAAQTAATQAAESASSANQDAQEAAESATQAAASQTTASESATQAQQAASDAQSAAGEIDAGLIVDSASGEVISVSDSASAKLRGLHLYGKSVQDGTPTPEAPAEIESAGDGGNITTYVFGQNLIDPMDTEKWKSRSGATFEVLGDGKIEVTGSASYSGVIYNIPSDITNLLKGKNCAISRTIDSQTNESAATTVQIIVKTASGLKYYSASSSPITMDADAISANFEIYVNNTSTTLETPNTVVFSNLGIYFGDTAQAWDTYQPMQTLTYPTPNGLPGIPVESGGNYTDAERQQWVCDEVDFGRGKYVQRVKIRSVESGDYGNISSTTSTDELNRCYINAPGKLLKKVGVRCNLFTYSKDYIYNTIPENYIIDEASTSVLFAVAKNYGSTFAEIRQKLINAGAKILYALATPVETDLTPEQLAAYAALTTYKPNTTVTTDSDPAAGIEVKYVADTKTYIDNKLAAISEAILGGTKNGNV